jgi:hypothetical protein
VNAKIDGKVLLSLANDRRFSGRSLSGLESVPPNPKLSLFGVRG